MHHSFFSPAKEVFWFWGNFWWKYQDYSLTFWPNSSIFITLSSQLTKIDFDFGAVFDENIKTIALLFGQKSSILISLSSQLTKIDFDFGAVFDENTKTIALLFGQKHPFSSLFFLNWQREVLILGQFLMKIPRL